MGFNVPSSIASSGGNYLKLKEGKNKLRIISSPVWGKEGWKDQKPVRFKDTQAVSAEVMEDLDVDRYGNKIKPFCALFVWDYEGNQVKLWNFKQLSIMKALEDLFNDEDFGDLTTYDISVIRDDSAAGKDRYKVRALSKGDVSDEVKKAQKALFSSDNEAILRLQLLFENGDPFMDEEAFTKQRAEKDFEALGE